MVAHRLVVILIACNVKGHANRLHGHTSDRVDIENLVKHFVGILLVAQLGIYPAPALLYPYVAHGGTARGLDGLYEGCHDVVAVVIAIEVAGEDDGAAVEVGHHVFTQLLPLGEACLAVFHVVAYQFVTLGAGIEVGIVDHYLRPVSQCELMAAEALGDDVIELMAELAEILLMGHALVGS